MGHADRPIDADRVLTPAGEISPDDVLRLACGDLPPGATNDPRRRAIAHAGEGLDRRGWDDFDRARQEGFLVVARTPPSRGRADLVRLWGWWCAATGQAEAVIRVGRDGAVADLDVDLSPTGSRFEPAALTTIGRARAVGGGGRWLASDETIHLPGVPLDAALGLVRELLGVGADPVVPTADARSEVESAALSDRARRTASTVPGGTPMGGLV